MSGLQAKIDARENELRQIETELTQMERRKGVLAVELALLRELQAEAEAESHGAKGTIAAGVGSTRRGPPGSNMSDKWKCVVVAAVKHHPMPIHNDDVPEIQRQAGQEPASREGIRSHVSTFKAQGLYEKTGIGSFRATRRAADLVGMRLGAGGSESPQGEPGSGQPRLNINH